MKFSILTIAALSVLIVACDNSGDSAKHENTSSEGVAEFSPTEAINEMESMSAETIETVKESASTMIESAENAAESASAMIETAKESVEEQATEVIASAQSKVEPVAAGPNGEAIYRKTCIGCHLTGAANAPKLGDQAAWAPRIAKGKQALYDSALNGIAGTAMVVRGSCGDCSDDDLKAAVDYMIKESQ